MAVTTRRALAESLVFLVIEYIVFILIIASEGFDLLFLIIEIALSVVYGAVVYFASRVSVKDAMEAGVPVVLMRSNLRRIGVGIAFFVVFSIIPFRGFNLLALFAAMDVIISLLPGSVVLFGNKLWRENKVIYLSVILLSVVFFFINLLMVPFDAWFYGFTVFFGNLFFLILLVFAALVVVGLTKLKST